MKITHYLKINKKIGVWLSVVIVLMLAYKGLRSESSQDEQVDEINGKAAMTITTAQPSVASMPLVVRANGNILPWQEAIVGAESNGLRLTQVSVNVGDVVVKDQVLATFSKDTSQAEMLQAKANSMEALATYENAKADAEKARSIEKTEALSQQQLARYFTQEKTALARYEAAQAIYQTAQLRLAQTQVKAPDKGIISARSATVGAVVGAGQELFRLIRQSRLEWRAEVTADEISQIKVGSTARITVSGGIEIKGVVRAVSPSADPHTRNILVYVDLSENTVLKAGTFATGIIQVGQRIGLSVPQQALVVRDGFTYLFTVDEQKKISQRKVQTGLRSGDHVEILQGLQANEQVAVQGAGFLNDGDVVRVVN
jgi:HlyD family secretion protein